MEFAKLLRLYGRHLLGLLFLLMVVCLWVGANFLMSFIFKDKKYDKPFFTTFLNTSSFSAHLVGAGLWLFFQRFCGRGATAILLTAPASLLPANERRSSDEFTQDALEADSLARDTSFTDTVEIETAHEKLPPLTLSETFLLSAQFCFLWFLANMCSNASLAQTDVASSTIISSTSALWTLIIGVLSHVENLSFMRVGSVALSITGVVLVTLSPSSSGSTSDSPKSGDYEYLVGDMFALFGAIFYGSYITLLKKKLGDETRVKMPLFFGFVGVINFLTLWPGFFILDFFGLEPFQWPPREVWGFLLLNSFLGTFLSEYLWLLAMFLTTPLIATMGLSLTIPLAVTIEVVRGAVFSVSFFLGASFVLAGFVAVNLAGIFIKWDKDLDVLCWSFVNRALIRLRLRSQYHEIESQ